MGIGKAGTRLCVGLSKHKVCEAQPIEVFLPGRCFEHAQETPRQTEDKMERLHLSAGLGKEEERSVCFFPAKATA